jgi:branched-chain amino acid aminotransferase
MWIFLNDGFVPEDQASISVFDHGFLYGDGVYETLRAYHGQFFLLERHLVRLRQSCLLIGLNLPIPEKQWPALLGETLRRNELTDGAVRITISRGKGDFGLDPSLCSRPTIVIMAKPFRPYPPSLKKEGIRLEIVEVRRNPISAQSPRIKSLSFLNNILAKQEALRMGGDDALMLNIEGEVSECPTSNVFFVNDGKIKTPSVDCGILEGVTREVVIMLGEEQGFSFEEGRYGARELLEADECFITNTGMEIMPVSRIGEKRIGTGCPGPLTAQLSQLFQENVERFLSPLPEE